MKPKSTLRSFLAIAGSSLLAISYSHGQIFLADSYLTSLSVASPTTVSSALNFPSYVDGPLTGSSTLTTTGYFGSLLYLTNNGASNTFDGNLIVDSGTLRVASSPFGANGGFTAPSMTSSDTITINRAGTLYIDDNFTSGVSGYTTNRFGTSGDRPAVNLAGGRIELNGLNLASSSVQTFGALTVSSGQATFFVTRFNGNPTLEFDSLSISKGAVANFYSATLGTGTNDSRIKFTTPPTLTNGILAGAKYWKPGEAGQGEFATYDATNGVRSFTLSDYTVYGAMDINAATSTENVRMTGAFAPVELTADVTVNSLNFNGNGGTWSLGGKKLTLGSGMFLRNGTNQAVTINNGTLTAGNGTDAIDLHIFTAQQNVVIDAVIANNASSVLTLVKSHGNTLTVSGGADNTYTGGTYVVDGQLTTGNTANRAYLGTGKAVVDNATLQLGNVGATSNSTGDDYTAINGGRINIASGAAGVYTSADTFNIAANSIIATTGGTPAAGQGLASLTRGTNITLAAGAIIGHSFSLSGALNTTTGTIQNLGTSADLYYGLAANQASASGSIDIGSATAFQGISTDRSARAWQLGTINIASGTTSVDFQGIAGPGVAPVVLTLGNGATANAPVINFAGTGTVDIRAIGSLGLSDDTATYGNTGSSQNVRFVATAGSTITVNTATGMGSATGIASALVQNGGTFAIGANSIPNALNGNVTVESGGKYLANRAGGLTGTGALTFNAGSILEITIADSFSGSQATAASIAAGTIVRLNANSFGEAGTTLDSVLGSGSNAPIFVIYGNNRGAADPTAPNTSIMTLNKSGGVGGILTNYEIGNRGLSATTNGVVTLGANGGTIAATTGNSLTVSEDITGSGSLTIGTTDIIDGLPKLGTVALSAVNTYTGGTIISAGTLQTNIASALGSTSGQLTVNTGGTLNMNTVSLTVGNLTGTGGTITGIASNRTLTIGQGDFGGGNYQGSIQNGGGTTALTKTGTGTITLSGTNTYTGATAVNVGTLFINGNQTSAVGNVTVAADATLGGTGTLGGNTAIADTGKLQFNLSTAAGSHEGLEIASGKALTLSGASTLTITSSSGASPGLYTLVSGGNNIVGLVPAMVVLPPTWTADPPEIVGNELRLNITFTGGGNTAPAISDIANQSVPSGGSTGALAFTVTDEDVNSVTPTGSSSNVTLVPNANIVFGGSGASRTVTVTPVSGLSGTATITVTLTDNGTLTAQDTFTLTVTDNYLSWATLNGVTGGEGGDHDNDGVKNLVEYALVNGGERGVLSGNTITYTKRGAPYGTDMTYIIETSETLVGAWTDAVTHSPALLVSNPTISYTFTPGTPVKKFARLEVVATP